MRNDHVINVKVKADTTELEDAHRRLRALGRPTAKDVVGEIATGAIVLACTALALSPVVWLIVHAYGWAL